MKNAARDLDFEALRRALHNFHLVPAHQAATIVLNFRFREILKISFFMNGVELHILHCRATRQQHYAFDLECLFPTNFLLKADMDPSRQCGEIGQFAGKPPVDRLFESTERELASQKEQSWKSQLFLQHVGQERRCHLLHVEF